MSSEETAQFPEHRKYIRCESIFPVDYTIVRIQGDLPGVEWQRGYTRNLSQGGICLETSQLSVNTIKYLNNQEIFIEMLIYLPTSSAPIRAIGQVAWFHPMQGKTDQDYFIGMSFNKIAAEDLKRLLKQAKYVKGLINIAILISLLVFSVIILLGIIGLSQRPSP